MFVSFIANRDIEVGEELMVNLYADPVNQYRVIGDKEFANYCI